MQRGRWALFKQMHVFKIHLGQGVELVVAALLFSNMKLSGRHTQRAFEPNQLFAWRTMQQHFSGLFLKIMLYNNIFYNALFSRIDTNMPESTLSDKHCRQCHRERRTNAEQIDGIKLAEKGPFYTD